MEPTLLAVAIDHHQLERYPRLRERQTQSDAVRAVRDDRTLRRVAVDVVAHAPRPSSGERGDPRAPRARRTARSRHGPFRVAAHHGQKCGSVPSRDAAVRIVQIPRALRHAVSSRRRQTGRVHGVANRRRAHRARRAVTRHPRGTRAPSIEVGRDGGRARLLERTRRARVRRETRLQRAPRPVKRRRERRVRGVGRVPTDETSAERRHERLRLRERVRERRDGTRRTFRGPVSVVEKTPSEFLDDVERRAPVVVGHGGERRASRPGARDDLVRAGEPSSVVFAARRPERRGGGGAAREPRGRVGRLHQARLKRHAGFREEERDTLTLRIDGCERAEGRGAVPRLVSVRRARRAQR